MPEQFKPENPAVVGEDGELLQPDTTVDPKAYTEYVATYVHRDPFLFRITENIREHRLMYLSLILVGLCMAITVIDDLFSNPNRLGSDILGLILLNLGIGIVAKIVYWILQTDTRQ